MASERTLKAKLEKRGKDEYLSCSKCGAFGGAIHLEESVKDKEGNEVKDEKGNVKKRVVRHFRTLTKKGDYYFCQACLS